MHEQPTTGVRPAPDDPAGLGLRLIDWQRQVDELATRVAGELAAMSDPDSELRDLGEVA